MNPAEIVRSIASQSLLTVRIFSLVPNGFQFEDHHLFAENPNYKCYTGKPREGCGIYKYVQIVATNLLSPLCQTHTESSGPFLQAAELCHPVWDVQPFLPHRTVWTVLQSLQQGTCERVYMTFPLSVKGRRVSFAGIEDVLTACPYAAFKERNLLNRSAVLKM